MKTNTQYKNEALAALKGNWAPAVLATVVFLAIATLCIGPAEIPMLTGTFDSEAVAAMAAAGDLAGVMDAYSTLSSWSSLSSLLRIFVYNVLSVGFAFAFLLLLRNGDDRLTSNMFEVSFRQYWHKVWGMFLMYLFIALWTLLFILPGIVKAFSYALTPFILEENPDLSANEAIDHSRAMMKGHKFDLFYLYLSFIGWFLLSFLTLGIGFIWLIPYMNTAQAAFYEDVKADYERNGGLI
ncbi:MAG: DUF975 family protein [Bacteroidales bacterium]|nr:DUF975 family protein [Bacteroidales bacterium]